MNKFPKKLNNGLSTLEILLAFAILILAITAVLQLGFGNQSLTVDQQTSEEALLKANSLLEEARSLSLLDFNSLESNTEIKDDIYTKNLLVTSDPSDPTNSDKKLVTAKVAWPLIGGRTPYIELSTLFTNFQNPGSKCKQILTGDWTKPQIYAYVDFPSPKGASAVDVEKNIMYITSDPSAAGTDDFYVVDIKNMTPGQGELFPVGHFSTSYGLTDVDTSGTYSYVSANSAAFQLLVIDVSSPSNLNTSKIVVKKDVTSASDTAVGNTLLYFNKRIYLGLTNSLGKEFHIFDVSEPTNPIELGTGYEIGSAINQIQIKNNIAYLATASSSEIIALNISNPLNLFPISGGTYSQVIPPFGQSLTLSNSNILYFGQIGINSPKLMAFNAKNISAGPQWTKNIGSGIYTMQLRGNLIFMTTADPNDGLQIWDISKVPPVRFDTTPLNIQQTATAGSDCVGNLLYVAQRSQRAIQIVGPHIYDTYSLSSSGDLTIIQGESDDVVITKKLISGSAKAENISVLNLPAGVTASVTNGNCLPDCTSTIKISTSLSSPLGSSLITINTPSGIKTNFNLEITAAPFDYSIVSAGDMSVKQGSQGNETITTQLVSGVSKPITLTLSSSPVLPASITYSLDNNPCTPDCINNLNISAANDPATKNQTFVITITGTTGSNGPKSTSFNLKIKP